MQFNEAATLADVLDKLDISQRVVISVNGKNEPDHSYKLQDGDEVKIFSSISGGVNNFF